MKDRIFSSLLLLLSIDFFSIGTNQRRHFLGRTRRYFYEFSSNKRQSLHPQLYEKRRPSASFANLDTVFYGNQQDRKFHRQSLRLSCYSCMSAYLEEQFSYVAYLYRKPRVFTDRCDEKRFNARYMAIRNCSNMCITMRIDDRVGGRKRHGYLRGCMTDILHHNSTYLSPFKWDDRCLYVRMSGVFNKGTAYGFDQSNQAHLCSCHDDLCNAALSLFGSGRQTKPLILVFALTVMSQLSLLSL